MHRYFIIMLAVAAVIAAIFLSFPEIDLKVSALFYREGEKFFLSEHPILMFLHNSVIYVVIALTIIYLSILLLSFLKKKDICGLSKKTIVYLMLALAIGPGLIVNTTFKDNWGRARPRQITEFGGTQQFTPPFIMTDQCKKNCSFVSGDPSVGFYFFALALAIPARRKFFITTTFALGGILGATRIMQGAHFLSDVIFSGVFTISCCYLLYLLMFRKKSSQATSN